MVIAGGTAGKSPAAHLKPSALHPGTFLRRIADGARASEEGIWKVAGRVAVTLPLVALVFALSVLLV